MGTTSELIQYLLKAKLEEIPPEVIQAAKKLFLDYLGCALAAYSMEENRRFIEALKSMGGAPEATILGDREKTSCFHAAYINAKLANLLDMDDVLWNVAHLGAMVMGPGLAIAERKRSSGAALLTAISLGLEVGARSSIAIGTIFDFDGKKLVYGTNNAYGFGSGIFGGTVASSHLLGLNGEELENALGVTGAYAPPPMAQKLNQDQSMVKYQMEWAAGACVVASLLAQSGFTGPARIFDDPLFSRAMGRSYYHPHLLPEDLGRRWYLPEISIKPYPSCRHIHYAVDLLGEILEKNDLKAEEIEEVKIQGLSRLTRWPWTNPAPQTMISGQFSLPYNMAVTAYRVRPGVDWYKTETMQDPRILDFSRKVRIEANPEMVEIEGIPEAFIRRPTIVEVRARGQVFSARKETARGDGWSPQERMGWEEVEKKFLWNAGRAIGEVKAREVAGLVDRLEKVSQMDELTRLLRPSGTS